MLSLLSSRIIVIIECRPIVIKKITFLVPARWQWMLGDLRAKDLSIISRASHSLKKVCWVFPFFDFYLQSLDDRWHDIQCMILTSVQGTGPDGSHIACKPHQPQFPQPTDVSPDRFNSCESELESCEDSPGMYRFESFCHSNAPYQQYFLLTHKR